MRMRKLGVQDLRWRIEHVQVLAPCRYSASCAIGCDCIHAANSCDIRWTLGDGSYSDLNASKAPMHGDHSWIYKTIIAGGSDAPVEEINPLWGIYAAITRQDHKGKPEGGWHPEQIVTRDEALRMFTVNAAYAAFRENELGSIKAGKMADLVVLPENILNCKPLK